MEVENKENFQGQGAQNPTEIFFVFGLDPAISSSDFDGIPFFPFFYIETLNF